MTRRPGSIATGLLITLGSLVAMAVAFLLAEALLRAVRPGRCATVDREAQMVRANLRFLEPCFVARGSGADERLVGPPMSTFDPRPYTIPRQRRAGVPRIAVVGASSADLLGRRLLERFDQPDCEGRYELLNCAQSGSALEHVERRFDEVLTYEPDAIVVLFGHNIFFQEQETAEYARLQALRLRSCLLSLFAEPAPLTIVPPLQGRLEKLEGFLRSAARRTRAKDLGLAVATMPSNLWLPAAAGLDEEDDPRFLEARFLEARGRREDAIALLESLTQDGDHAYWQFQLGEQLARAGDHGRAYEALHTAVDKDFMGLRAPSRVNDLIRAVAKQEELLLRDTERSLESRVPNGLPGWESFVDNCHLLTTTIDDEIDALLMSLREIIELPSLCKAPLEERFRKDLRDVLEGVLNLSASGSPDFLRRWDRGLALAVESWLGRDFDRANADVNEFLDGAAFRQIDAERQAGLLVAIADGYYRAGQPESAFTFNQRARDMGSAAAWVQNGLFDIRQDELQKAHEAFERALALDSTRKDARGFLRLLSRTSEQRHARGAGH